MPVYIISSGELNMIFNLILSAKIFDMQYEAIQIL